MSDTKKPEAVAPVADTPPKITRTPGVYGGKPLVKGVPVDVLVNRYAAGDSIEFLADDFDITPADVQAALAYATAPTALSPEVTRLVEAAQKMMSVISNLYPSREYTNEHEHEYRAVSRVLLDAKAALAEFPAKEGNEDSGLDPTR